VIALHPTVSRRMCHPRTFVPIVLNSSWRVRRFHQRLTWIDADSSGTFDYQPKKRGPPNLCVCFRYGTDIRYVRRLQDKGPTNATPSNEKPSPSVTRRPPVLPSTIRLSPRQDFPYPTTNTHPVINPPPFFYENGPGPGTLAHQNAVQASALSRAGMGVEMGHGRDVGELWEPSLNMLVLAGQSSMPLDEGSLAARAGPSRASRESRYGGSRHSSHFETGPSLDSSLRSFNFTGEHSFSKQTPEYPVELSPSRSLSRINLGPSPNEYSPQTQLSLNSTNPFESVLPRDLLYTIIDLYFDYIYCLIPCVHKPTFMADIHMRREEREGEDEWIAMVFSILAATLAQIPRAFVPLPKSEVKTLMETCNSIARLYLGRDFAEPTLCRCE
jgi:hypothetical protein